MVSEAVTEQAYQQQENPADSGLEFEIVDETSDEQVERERTLLNPAKDEASANEPEARDEQSDVPDAEPSAERGDDVPADSANTGLQQQRVYSQAEVSKMQSAWARQIESARNEASKASEQLQQFNLDAAVEAMLKKQETDLASRLGVDRAQEMVRSPHNAALVRQSLATHQQLKRAETERSLAVEQQERQARFVVAQALARQHGVSADDFNLLSTAPTPEAMQGLARRLGTTGASAMRDRVPAETPQTQLENGYHAGPQPENAERRLERIRAKPSWEWTEADLRYMKTGEMR